MKISGDIKSSALGLSSGGLDSILSAITLRAQGIIVHWIAFETPFFVSKNVRYASKKYRIPLYVKNITYEYLEMMISPISKFGKNMNPCIDCHSLMFNIAGYIMYEKKIDIMFSGEILGQRPMSQNIFSLNYVEKKSSFRGDLIRPLSFKKLVQSDLEDKKKIQHIFLLGLSGRSRKIQINLVSKLGLNSYPSAGGGCLLTDSVYCKKLKDLFKYQKRFSMSSLELLNFGRHLRLGGETKIIVGRNYEENIIIASYIKSCENIFMSIPDIPGPVLFLYGNKIENFIGIAASICVGYTKAKNKISTRVVVNYGFKIFQIEAVGILPSEIKNLFI